MGHEGQGSGSISAVVLWAIEDATWFLDHGDPAHYSLQTICSFTVLHSSTCHSWKMVIFTCSTSFTTSLKPEGFQIACAACVGRKREGHDTKQLLCNNAPAAVLTPVSKRLVAASHLWTLLHWPQIQLTTKQQATAHPHNYSILITVKILHRILKPPSAKINWP